MLIAFLFGVNHHVTIVFFAQIRLFIALVQTLRVCVQNGVIGLKSWLY